MWWFATRCYQWLKATETHEVFSFDRLGGELEGILEAYRQSLLGKTSGVPRAMTEVATSIAFEKIVLQQQGPADAVASSRNSSDAEVEDDGVWKSAAREAKQRPRYSMDSSMAVTSSGLDDAGPLSLWPLPTTERAS